jgi:ABC-2 type transport system ATP-binding protein
MLIINNLEKKFGNFDAVKKINFSIKKNQTVALLGPNGCGKTTTIAMILGLITPTSGSIIINDQTLTKNHHYLSKMNFASPYVELPKKLKVIENLKVYAMMYEVKNPKNKIEQLIDDPEILLLDEPTASLDPDTGDFIRTFLEKYKKKNSMATLLASHNMDEVTRLSDYVLMMKEGTIIDQGTASELIEKHGRDNLEEVFLKLARQHEH